MNKLYIIEDKWGVQSIYSSLAIEVVELIDGDDIDPYSTPLNAGVIYAFEQLAAAKKNSKYVYVRVFDHKKGDWTLKPYGWNKQELGID